MIGSHWDNFEWQVSLSEGCRTNVFRPTYGFENEFPTKNVYVSCILCVHGVLPTEERFQQNVDAQGEDRDGEFDMEQFSASLRAPLFWLQLDSILAIEDVVLGLANWSEACPCHYRWLGQMSRRERELYMTAFINLRGKDTCPLVGRRAPELAAGQLNSVLETLARKGLADLLNGETAVRATPRMIQATQYMFIGFKNHIALFLTMKLDFWSKPPYVFAGLGHWDRQMATQCGAMGRAAFDRHPNKDAHHRMTWLFCHTLRADLDRFVDGIALADLSDQFRAAVAKLFFIPVAERSIEAKHSLAKMALYCSRLKGSTVNVSLSNRLPILRNVFQDDPDMFADFIKAFEYCRNHAACPITFGLEGHPAVRACVGQHHTRVTHVLRAVIYRSDLWSPTHSVRPAELHHSNGKDAATILAEKIVSAVDPAVPSQKLSIERIRQHAALCHLRGVANTHDVFSLPAGAVNLSSLSDATTAGARPRSGPELTSGQTCLNRTCRTETS